MAQPDLAPSSESKETSMTDTTVGEPRKEDMEASNNPVTQDDAKVTDEKKEQTDNPEDDMEYPHGIKLAIILSALCLSVFLVALDQTIIATVRSLLVPCIKQRSNACAQFAYHSIIRTLLT